MAIGLGRRWPAITSPTAVEGDALHRIDLHLQGLQRGAIHAFSEPCCVLFTARAGSIAPFRCVSSGTRVTRSQ